MGRFAELSYLLVMLFDLITDFLWLCPQKVPLTKVGMWDEWLYQLLFCHITANGYFSNKDFFFWLIVFENSQSKTKWPHWFSI